MKKKSWIDKFLETDLYWWGLYGLMLGSLLVFSKDVLSVPHILLGFMATGIFILHNGLMKIANSIKELKK